MFKFIWKFAFGMALGSIVGSVYGALPCIVSMAVFIALALLGDLLFSIYEERRKPVYAPIPPRNYTIPSREEVTGPRTPFKLFDYPKLLLVYRNGRLLNQGEYRISGNAIIYCGETSPTDAFTFIYW